LQKGSPESCKSHESRDISFAENSDRDRKAVIYPKREMLANFKTSPLLLPEKTKIGTSHLSPFNTFCLLAHIV
jgi:hypothetical protein